MDFDGAGMAESESGLTATHEDPAAGPIGFDPEQIVEAIGLLDGSAPGEELTGAGSAPGPDTIDDGSGHQVTVATPTFDATGDGVPDTTIVHQADGTIIGYTDSDGNGNIDHITQVGPDGSVLTATASADGNWVVDSHGHLGSADPVAPNALDPLGATVAAEMHAHGAGLAISDAPITINAWSTPDGDVSFAVGSPDTTY